MMKKDYYTGKKYIEKISKKKDIVLNIKEINKLNLPKDINDIIVCYYDDYWKLIYDHTLDYYNNFVFKEIHNNYLSSVEYCCKDYHKRLCQVYCNIKDVCIGNCKKFNFSCEDNTHQFIKKYNKECYEKHYDYLNECIKYFPYNYMHLVYNITGNIKNNNIFEIESDIESEEEDEEDEEEYIEYMMSLN